MASFALSNIVVFDASTQTYKKVSSWAGAGNTLDFGAGTVKAASFEGVASKAAQLETARNFSIGGSGGDATALAVSFNGTAAVDLTLTLATVLDGTTDKVPGTFGDGTNVAQVTVDAKGRVTTIKNIAIAFPSDANYAKLNAANTFTASGNVFSNGLTVRGGMTIDGPVISEGATNLNVVDPFINLRLGGVSAGVGGIVVSVEPLGSALTGVTFSSKLDEGGAGNRAKITVSDASGISVGDLIQITASKGNEGYYFVQAVSGNVLSIRTVLEDSLAAAPFASNDVTSGTEASAVAQKVSVTSIAVSDGNLLSLNGVIAKGLPCYAKGSTFAEFSYDIASPSAALTGWTILVPGVETALVGVVGIGNVLAYNASGEAVKATNVLSSSLYDVELVAMEANASGTARKAAAVAGKTVIVNVGSETISLGAKLYLGTDGKATATAPTASGSVIVYLGKAVSAGFSGLGSDKGVLVRFAPEVVIVNE